METSIVFPREVIVDPKEKLVITTPDLLASFPDVPAAFEQVDRVFEANRHGFVSDLKKSQFSFNSTTGATFDCSLIPGNGNRLLVMWAPFSDCAPRSSASSIYEYMVADADKLPSKSNAAPNSWSQITKSGVVSELLKAVDLDMPVLTIFSPLPSFPHNAYTHNDYKYIRQGDFTPASRIADEAIAAAQDRLHGPQSETQLDQLDFHGASLGASHAIGAATGTLLAGERQVHSVTAQELIISPSSVLGDLALRFTIKDPRGKPSVREIPENSGSIAEPLIRQKITRAGNELAMVGRMLRGMSKVSRLKGLTRPERNLTPKHLEYLQERGVSTLIPLAESSGLTYDTPLHLLGGSDENVVNVCAVKGERTAHLIDEQVALTALLAVLNIRNTSQTA
jgi:hypothetical protein